MKKKIIAIVACVAIIAAGVGLYFYFNSDKTDEGAKSITLTISADGEKETYTVETNAEMLGEMLVDEGYVKNDQGEYGLYIQTVYGPFKDGRTADGNKEEWWKLLKNGENLSAGADETPIADGDKYDLILELGYDNF